MKPENMIEPIQYRISSHATGGGLLHQLTARIHALKGVVLRLFSV